MMPPRTSFSNLDAEERKEDVDDEWEASSLSSIFSEKIDDSHDECDLSFFDSEKEHGVMDDDEWEEDAYDEWEEDAYITPSFSRKMASSDPAVLRERSSGWKPTGDPKVVGKVFECYKAKNYMDVVKVAEEALDMAEEHTMFAALSSDKLILLKYAAIIYHMLGHSFIECFQHLRGLGLLEQARTLALEAGANLVLTDVCSHLGDYHQQRGDQEKAIAEFEQAMAMHVELGNRSREAMQCEKLGMSYMSLKQYDKAIELYEQCLDISNKLGDTSMQARLYQALIRLDLKCCQSLRGEPDLSASAFADLFASALGLSASSAVEEPEATWGSRRVHTGLAVAAERADTASGEMADRTGAGSDWQMADNLSAGVRVRLHSLQAAAQHNGVDGHLLEWNSSKGRWLVKLSTGQELSVRPANVMPMCSHAGCGQRMEATEQAGTGLKKCKRCKQVKYCSKKCQVEAWKNGHKAECKDTETGKEEAEEAERKQSRLMSELLATPHQKKALLEALMAHSHDDDSVDETILAASMQSVFGSRGGEDNILFEKTFKDLFPLFSARKYSKITQEMATDEVLATVREQQCVRPLDAAEMLRMLGTSFKMCGNRVKGMELLEQARALAAKAGILGRFHLGTICNDLGICHQEVGEYVKAIEALKLSKAIAVEHGNEDSEDLACNSLGLCYTSDKQYDKAIELFEQSMALSEKHGRRLRLAETRCNLGRCLFLSGQLERAAICLKQSFTVFQDLEFDLEENLQTRRMQTEAALHLGQLLLAQARVELQQLQSASDAAGSNESLHARSAACAESLKDAETWLRTATDLALHNGLVCHRMKAHFHLAYVAFSRGRTREAVLEFVRHLDGWVCVGRKVCVGCGQMRGEDAPIFKCDGCHVARSEYPATGSGFRGFLVAVLR